MKTPWIKALTILPIVVFLLSCDVEESPPKSLSSFAQIQSNGTVTFKLVSGADNRVISTYLSEASYNVTGNTLSVNAAGGSMTVETVNLVVVKAFDLAVDSVYVNSSSVVDTEVNASKVVNAFINSSGDVKYRGNPPIVRLTKTGTGRLIPD